MDKLLSDSPQVEIKGRVKDIILDYVIGNCAVRKYQHVKRTTNRMIERNGSPANTWMLDIVYVCCILNHTI